MYIFEMQVIDDREKSFHRNTQSQLSDCIAQFVEHCIGIAGSWVQIPLKPPDFYVSVRDNNLLKDVRTHCYCAFFRTCHAHVMHRRPRR